MNYTDCSHSEDTPEVSLAARQVCHDKPSCTQTDFQGSMWCKRKEMELSVWKHHIKSMRWRLNGWSSCTSITPAAIWLLEPLSTDRLGSAWSRFNCWASCGCWVHRQSESRLTDATPHVWKRFRHMAQLAPHHHLMSGSGENLSCLRRKRQMHQHVA